MHRLLGNPDLRKLLNWAYNCNLFTFAINNKFDAILAKNTGNRFIYKGYQIAAFPEATDNQTLMVGYILGPMT